ncbi:MAG: PDZ domain-containing protein [Halanaerobiales bacterium]
MKGFVGSIAGVVFIVLILSFFVPLPLMIMSPGIAQELSPMITVEDGYKGQSQGDFMLTAVSSQRATIWDYAYISIQKPLGVELEPISEHLPKGMNMEQYYELMKIMMEDSKNQSVAIAFKKAGYQVDITYHGAVIEDVLDNGIAKGKLQIGDIIIAVDEKEVRTNQDAIDIIREHDVGDEVKITVKRGEETLDYTMKTKELENHSEESIPSIGVRILSKVDYDFPREVIFHTENIGGSSAGGMFTLEIYNQLTENDITSGRRIAGTGTIDQEGNIGAIDGVEQKVIAAERNDAVIFLVPAENYEAAKETATTIEVVLIETIDDAINYLEGNLN